MSDTEVCRSGNDSSTGDARPLLCTSSGRRASANGRCLTPGCADSATICPLSGPAERRETGSAPADPVSAHKEMHRAGDAFVRLPIDLRRSGCPSENHQPRALRTRCKQQSRGPTYERQEPEIRTLRNLRIFLFTTAILRSSLLALDRLWTKRVAGPEGPATDSPSRERFRPPSRGTFRFRVRLLGGLRPTGAPCSAQGGQ